MKKYWRDGIILYEWKINVFIDKIIFEKRLERNESDIYLCSLYGYSFLFGEFMKVVLYSYIILNESDMVLVFVEVKYWNLLLYG